MAECKLTIIWLDVSIQILGVLQGPLQKMGAWFQEHKGREGEAVLHDSKDLSEACSSAPQRSTSYCQSLLEILRNPKDMGPFYGRKRDHTEAMKGP